MIKKVSDSLYKKYFSDDISKLITSLLIFNFLYGFIGIFLNLHEIRVYLSPAATVIAVPFLIYILYFKRSDLHLLTLLGLAFIGAEYLPFLFPVFIAPRLLISIFNTKNYVSKIGSIEKVVYIFMLYALMISIITSFVDFAPLNNALWFGIAGSGFIIVLYGSTLKLDELTIRKSISFLKSLIILQLILVVLKSLISGKYEPGDWFRGSLENPHYVGFYCSLYLCYVFLPFMYTKGLTIKQFIKHNNIPLVVITILVLIVSDSKTIVLTFFLSVGVFSVYFNVIRIGSQSIFTSLKKILIRVTFFLLICFSFTFLAKEYSKLVPNFPPDLIGFIELHVIHSNHNKKAVFYKRIFRDHLRDEPLLWFFGVGPGKIGSKASNALAYDVLYKEEHRKWIQNYFPQHSSPWVLKYMSDLYSDTQREIHQYSGQLSSPFSGIISIKAELGIVGLILFVVVIIALFHSLMKTYSTSNDLEIKRWALTIAFFWLALLLLMVFDNYHEKLTIVPALMTVVLLSTTQPSNKSCASESKEGAP